MARAFGSIRENLILHFVTADALAFCYTLQKCASSERASLTANWYRRQFDLKLLGLDPGEYGSSGNQPGPVLFNAIDTADLSNSLGALVTLLAARPLLLESPVSALFMQVRLQSEGAAGINGPRRNTFDSLLEGDTSAIALLLRLFPTEYLTNNCFRYGLDVTLQARVSCSALLEAGTIHHRPSLSLAKIQDGY